MKFDLTPQIKLEKADAERYQKYRMAVWALFFLFSFFVFWRIFFPSAYFIFSFENPGSSKNTLAVPRGLDESPIKGDVLPADSTIIFDATKTGNYSKVRLELELSGSSDDLEKSEVILRKSFQAFFYPEGEPLGFSEGTLLESEGKYFIVSKGKLRQFESLSEAKNMGFSENAFWKTSEEDLKHNPPGEMVRFEEYPEGSAFRIEESYYILKEGKLWEFVSQKAFLSRFSEVQAIPKDENFLKKYEIPEEEIGFADGTLVSYGISAFVISDGKILPINNPETFLAAGYAWEDLTPISGDEYSLYEKEKLFTISTPHPDGTVFETTEDGKFFLIKDLKKHLLPTANIARSYSKAAAIKISGSSLETFEKCELEKSPFESQKYFCNLPLLKFSGLIGKDYEFQLAPKNEIDAETLEITLSKAGNFSNFKSSIGELIGKIITSYANKI